MNKQLSVTAIYRNRKIKLSRKPACGSKDSSLAGRELNAPFPLSPGGEAGARGFFPRRMHAARQQKTLASAEKL